MTAPPEQQSINVSHTLQQGAAVGPRAYGLLLAEEKFRDFNRPGENTLTEMSLGARAVNLPRRFKNETCSVFLVERWPPGQMKQI